ncbi:MAG TPA: HAMP domain-containing sensor histidine kinase [Polyangiaceae bacterium]|nr:HAMP domain-containing sensor histidine kinase [Polyangiaceae bacterium]
MNVRPEEASVPGEQPGMRSDVWAVRSPVGGDPGPVAFAVHDAKNMVGVLAANVDVLRRALGDARLPTAAVQALADIEEAAFRLNGLVREALVGLQGREAPRPAPRRLRVAPMVTAAVERMRPAARARGIRIVEMGTEGACATIDADLFERVIVNLLENAVRFSAPGDTVEVEYEHRNGRLTLAVGDRGPGVPEDAREQIFESYRRHDGERGEGAHFGLGLAFCREVAKAHGGDAWAFNRAGGGACFVFEIV